MIQSNYDYKMVWNLDHIKNCRKGKLLYTTESATFLYNVLRRSELRIFFFLWFKVFLKYSFKISNKKDPVILFLSCDCYLNFQNYSKDRKCKLLRFCAVKSNIPPLKSMLSVCSVMTKGAEIPNFSPCWKRKKKGSTRARQRTPEQGHVLYVWEPGSLYQSSHISTGLLGYSLWEVCMSAQLPGHSSSLHIWPWRSHSAHPLQGHPLKRSHWSVHLFILTFRLPLKILWLPGLFLERF